MIEINLRPTDRMLRQFSGAWLVVLSALAVNQWLLRGHPRAGAALLIIAAVPGIAGLLRPRTVRWLLVACTVAAFPIGWLVSQAMLLILFALVITPVALLFKLRGRDRLSRKRQPRQESYWKPKAPAEDVRRYLRQY
jgi:hypothetical protein